MTWGVEDNWFDQVPPPSVQPGTKTSSADKLEFVRKEKTKVSRISGFCKHAGLAELADASLGGLRAGWQYCGQRAKQESQC